MLGRHDFCAGLKRGLDDLAARVRKPLRHGARLRKPRLGQGCDRGGHGLGACVGEGDVEVAAQHRLRLPLRCIRPRLKVQAAKVGREHVNPQGEGVSLEGCVLL